MSVLTIRRRQRRRRRRRRHRRRRRMSRAVYVCRALVFLRARWYPLRPRPGGTHTFSKKRSAGWALRTAPWVQYRTCIRATRLRARNARRMASATPSTALPARHRMQPGAWARASADAAAAAHANAHLAHAVPPSLALVAARPPSRHWRTRRFCSCTCFGLQRRCAPWRGGCTAEGKRTSADCRATATTKSRACCFLARSRRIQTRRRCAGCS